MKITTHTALLMLHTDHVMCATFAWNFYFC